MLDDDTSLAPQPRRPREWGRAVRALRGLLANPDDTSQVFKIIDALSSGVPARTVAGFEASRAGQRLLAERPEILRRLEGRRALAALPAGSLGRAYVDFMNEGSLSAEFLVAASETVNPLAKHAGLSPISWIHGVLIGLRHTQFGTSSPNESTKPATSHALRAANACSTASTPIVGTSA